MIYNFDVMPDRSRERSKTWDFRTLKPGQIPMHGAETHFTCPEPVKEAVRAVSDWDVYGYPYFTDDFSNAAAGYMKRRHNWDCKSEWVEFVGGIIPGIAFAIQAISEPGDKVLINTPIYDHFREVVEANDRVLTESPLIITSEGTWFDWDDMECRFADDDVKAYILCDPINPTGKSCTRDELEKISELAEKYHVLVIVDEVHADFIFRGEHISYPSVNKSAEQNSVVVINPSKTFNVAGFRTGAVIVPNTDLLEKIRKKIIAVKGYSRTITGVAAFEACYDGRCDDYVDQVNDYIRLNNAFLENYLTESIPQIKMVHPDGCFVCWLDCSGLGYTSQEELMAFLNSTGVLLSNGAEYDRCGRGINYVRMAYGFPRYMLAEALQKLEKAIKER